MSETQSTALPRKILIANRGEIACRVIKTAQRLGIRCVAVYSEVDAKAKHVQMADEAYLLGPAPSAESYLRTDKILEICRTAGIEAVHPGYGFLSENAEFATELERHGITFIGPPASAITSMGSKSAAKAIMSKADVPLVPGYHEDDQDPQRLKQASIDCGYPQLLKAVAGGGGKGMRVVRSVDEFDSALQAAQREAQNSFANPDMLIERYLEQPRHIEVQVFCDQHGNGVYLADRDCSIQRRHQKIIEEAPAPNLADETRKAMGEAAVRAAQAIDYVGAGTVEFLYDTDGSFYFMEMNTRLQVEHPVTEYVTGVDLVEWQLAIAAGAQLPLTQDQIKAKGHAIETRIYAEDPAQDFLPATGTLKYLSTPEESDCVRIDSGVRNGDEVSPYYDPMIAKLIVWGEDRNAAILRLNRALSEYRIAGLKTNLKFLRDLASEQPFADLDLDTGFIERHYDLLFAEPVIDSSLYLAIAASLFGQLETPDHSDNHAHPSPFTALRNWRLNIPSIRTLQLQQGEAIHDINIEQRAETELVTIDEHQYSISLTQQDDQLRVQVDDQQLQMHFFRDGNELHLFHHDLCFQCRLHQTTHVSEQGKTDHSLTAPMNGVVVEVLVAQGQSVQAGEALVIMEAMKMEHSISAPHAGKVSEVFFAAGDLVEEGAELLELEFSEEEAAS
ncbi:acetyl/propionyl/methylcrotonyl-CoA carboxylase subunit alpha [Neptuniibacter sp. QD57_21]|uniref:acetyl/propionyl/methylcrotonyl-CoA carboxylase subunit alpha n=1 Tax=Neptuniibacter sp. QD57_21 TaxID=3398213 RepID=UPI0039F565D0